LRQAGALLAARQFDEASTHIDAALAIDPASLAALTLRDRLMTLRAQVASSAPASSVPAQPDAPSTPRFVPTGVNAASWLDFEQRIQERRFRALLEAADRAVASGDGVSARASIEEARELQPDSGEVARLSARAALLQLPTARAQESFFRSRTFRAASLLLLGVMSLMGLDWVRSGPGQVPDPRHDALVTTRDSAVNATAASSAPRDTAIVPDVQGTTGETDQTPERLPLTFKSLAFSASPPPVVVATPAAPERPTVPGETPDDYVVPSSRPLRATATPPPQIVRGEVSDDYVAPRRDAGRDSSLGTARPTPSTPLTSVVRQPVAFESLATSTPTPSPTSAPAPPPAAVVAPAVAPVIAPPTVTDDSRINALLNQYTSAYGQLNASAVRSIWPTVDERALAKAFANLSSQTMSFDNCDINVNGATARASCRGRASYVVKVGSQERHNEPRTVRFDLKRDGEGWKIQKAETSR
jgi:hypothetical protein